jgi:hypothetical protein
MNRKNKLFFEVLESTFNIDKLICFMDNFVAQTIKKTVVILDNSPIHRSKKFKAKIQEWREHEKSNSYLSVTIIALLVLEFDILNKDYESRFKK